MPVGLTEYHLPRSRSDRDFLFPSLLELAKPEKSRTRSLRCIHRRPRPGVGMPESPDPPRGPRLVHDRIVGLLDFNGMTLGEDHIEPPYGDTFEWIWKGELSGNEGSYQRKFAQTFPLWLSSTSGHHRICQIIGPAGSGRSTFMKYISQHASTLRYLETWTCESGGSERPDDPIPEREDRTLIVLKYFYHCGKINLPQTYEGLLRTLLFQVLHSLSQASPDTDVARSMFPYLWEEVGSLPVYVGKAERDWTQSELESGFTSFLNLLRKDLKVNVCLFLDDIHRMHWDDLKMTKKFVQHISIWNHIKICVTSLAGDVMAQGSAPHVGSQVGTCVDLTDILSRARIRYTRHRLLSNTRIREIQGEMPVQLEDFFDRIVRLSNSDQGYSNSNKSFRWAKLVVERLIQQTDTNTTITILESRLDSFPCLYSELIPYLLFGAPGQKTVLEKHKSAFLVRLVEAREATALVDRGYTSPSLGDVAFTLSKSDDEDYFDTISEPTAFEIEELCRITAQGIIERTGGLLKIRSRSGLAIDAKMLVTYCSPTIRAWFTWRGFWTSHWDPHLQLLKSYVLQLQLKVTEVSHEGIALSLTHAVHIQKDPTKRYIQYLDRLSDLLTKHDSDAPNPDQHWTRHLLGTNIPPRYPLLCLAAKYGLFKYLKHKINEVERFPSWRAEDPDENDPPEDRPPPLITYAIEHIFEREHPNIPLSDPEMLRFLVEAPCKLNPSINSRYRDPETDDIYTPWRALLRACYTAQQQGLIKPYNYATTIIDDGFEVIQYGENAAEGCASIFQCFMDRGIDPEEYIDEPRVTALQVLEGLYQSTGYRRIYDLIKRLRKHIARLEEFRLDSRKRVFGEIST